LLVHVISATVAAVSADDAPMLTVSTDPTLAAVTVLPADANGEPVFAVHAMAASAVNRFEEGVIVTVPEFGTAVVGVKVTTRLPPATPVV
jgi:hypothetical protein